MLQRLDPTGLGDALASGWRCPCDAQPSVVSRRAKKPCHHPPDFPAKPRCVLYRIIGNDLVPVTARARCARTCRSFCNRRDAEQKFERG